MKSTKSNRASRRRSGLGGRAAVSLTLIALAACGSDNGAELDRAVIVGPATPSDATAPVATLPDDLGEAAVVDQAVAPMSIIGEPLPYFAGGFGQPDNGIGETAPVILGYDVEGEAYRIDPAQDGPTMVVLAAHWCPHCAVELPLLIDMKQQGELPAELNAYAVMASSNPQAVNWPPTEWLRGLGWTDPILLDGVGYVKHDGKTLLRGIINPAMGSDGFPTVLLIDADGTLVARWSGEVPREKMLEAIYASFPDLDPTEAAAPTTTGS